LPGLFVANCKPRNWDGCRKGPIYGIKEGSRHPGFERGDIFLLRVSGQGYGVRGIWILETQHKVEKPSDVPWTDAEYEWLLTFTPLVLEFREPFHEEFEGKSKYSAKIKLNSGRIEQSVVRLSPSEAGNYLRPIIEEKRNELNASIQYLGRDVTARQLLEEAAERATPAALVLMQLSPEFTTYDDQIGEQYHYPRQYFDRVVEGARFVYCRPQEGRTEAERRQNTTVYFGTGKIGPIRKDATKEGHRYCDIIDYFEFPNEVPYRDENRTYLETGSTQMPVMQSAVRAISPEAFQRIVGRSGLTKLPTPIFQRIQAATNEDEEIQALDEIYQSAAPKVKHYLAKRIERANAIGGKVKELNKYVCQICGLQPFTTKTGRLYAEAHHHTPLHRLTTGSLASQNVICVCANCHRKIHYGNVELIAADDDVIKFDVDGKRVNVKRNRLRL